MMRRLTICGACLWICAFCFAQQRQIVKVLPEDCPDGKLFTMEEVAGRLKNVTKPSSWNAPGASGQSKKALTEDGSLYILEDGEKRLIAAGGDGIRYGESVSRNEFGIKDGIFWSPDSSRLAFYRKDESRVSEFPLLDIKTRTGELRNIRYPMNGMASEMISLGIYNLENGNTTYLEIDDFDEERYLSNVSWHPDSRHIYVTVGARSQHELRLNKYDGDDGRFLLTVLEERNDAWVEPYEPLHFVGDGGKFIYSTDNRDGYKSLYLCSDKGIERRLTNADTECVFAGLNGNTLYYTSREDCPAGMQLFCTDIKRRNARPKRLTDGDGFHSITMLSDGYIDRYSSACDPGYTLKCNFDGSVSDTLARGGKPMDGYARCRMEFGTIKSADGKYDNWYRLIKPLNFNPKKKYPLLVYVYGGPHLQMVTDSYLAGLRNWEMYMAQRGYVVYVQDNRGTPGHGAAYEKEINRRCGQEEMKDQMVGIRSLMEEPWIDSSRIAVSGWSYGGFMTISLMVTYPEIFKAGVCGGPVIDWKWYEIMYGERYMDTPQTNPEGFGLTSLMGKADRLKGRLLICQGAIDDTVVWQHSLNFVQECIEKGIQVEYFPYPCTKHNVGGRWRMHLYEKWTEFIERSL